MDPERAGGWSRRGLLKAGAATAGAGFGSGSVSAETHGAEDTEAGEELWRFGAAGVVSSGPTVVDGTVYVNSLRQYYSYAVDAATGEEVWRFGGAYPRTSAVVVDGGIFFGGLEGLYAISRGSGELYWKRPENYIERRDSVLSTPDFRDSSIYAAVHNPERSGGLDAYDAETGEVDWACYDGSGGGNRGSSPLVIGNSMYYGSSYGHLLCLGVEDQEHGISEGGPGIRESCVTDWRFEKDTSFYTPTYYQDKIYAGDSDGTVHALDAETGESEWKYDAEGGFVSCPTVFEDVVYIGSKDARLYALDAESGEELWSYESLGSLGWSSPTVAGDTVFVGSDDRSLHAVDRETGEGLWGFAAGDAVSSSPIVVDGVVYFGSADQNLYAVDAGVEGSSVGTRVKQGRHGHHHVYHEERSTGELDFEEEDMSGFGFIAAAGAVAAGSALRRWRRN